MYVRRGSTPPRRAAYCNCLRTFTCLHRPGRVTVVKIQGGEETGASVRPPLRVPADRPGGGGGRRRGARPAAATAAPRARAPPGSPPAATRTASLPCAPGLLPAPGDIDMMRQGLRFRVSISAGQDNRHQITTQLAVCSRSAACTRGQTSTSSLRRAGYYTVPKFNSFPLTTLNSRTQGASLLCMLVSKWTMAHG